MARKKVKLAFIVNDAKRKAAYKNRKNRVTKMASDISTLCGIDACAIIYSMDEPYPTVWPSPRGVQRVLDRFRRVSEHEQSKHTLNQEGYLRKSITKAQEKLTKLKNENRKKETALFMINSLSIGGTGDNVNIADLNDLSLMINDTLKEIQEIRAGGDQIPEPTPVVANGGVEDLPWEMFMTPDVDGDIQRMMMDPMQLQQEWSMDALFENLI